MATFTSTKRHFKHELRLLNKLSFYALTFAVFALSGCAAKDAKPRNGMDQIESAGAAGSEATSSTPASVAATDLGGSMVAQSSTAASSTARGDTTRVKVEVPHVPGRSKKDSIALVMAIRAGMKDTRWPVKAVPILPGSILPAKRIVAFYGNPLSKKMGVLGELPPADMLKKFDKEIEEWRKADPSTPVQPALHLIAVVAQGYPGRDGKYRLRMTDSLINMVAGWAASRNALLFLDVQVGQSTVQEELPRLIPFLKRPGVHLGIDPEFSMKFGDKPGTRIGTMNASDVNFAVKLLSDLVTQNHLPPKVLIVHRFTRGMLTDASSIHRDPRVQIVVNMDGWGPPWLKFDSYRAYVEAEPVEFTGFKLFYHNDTKKGDPLLTPAEVLRLHPRPLYIQYQ
jgi:hypothetical protein